MGKTQRELADVIGAHPVTVARWETGWTINARHRTMLNDIARVHNYPPLAPARRKRKGRPEIVIHLPEGWRERIEGEVTDGTAKDQD